MSSAHDATERQPAAADPSEPAAPATPHSSVQPPAAPREIGGRGGLDPVRYGDWEKDGRCIDF